MPHQRLMFTPTTCTCSTRPSIARIAPQMAKSRPMGTRRSNVISPEDEIERGDEHEHHGAEKRRALPPREALVARARRQAVDEPLQLGLPFRRRRHADRDRHEEADRPRPRGAPEVLRHVGRVLMEYSKLREQ